MFNFDITESDRGIVIVAAANIEDFLDNVLKTIVDGSELPNKKQKSIFDSMGPFGNFSAKYHILIVFGYISRSAFDDLEKLRKIRNQFAHSSEDVKLHNPKILSILKSMSCFKTASKLMNKKLGLPEETIPDYSSSIEDHEVLSQGLIKRAKVDFNMAIAVLMDCILKDIDKRLVVQKN